MDVSRFSLLQLPQNAILKVLHAIDILELFLLSTISKKSKILVKSLNFECKSAGVKIDNDTVHCWFFVEEILSDVLDIDFKYEVPVDRKLNLSEPHCVTLSPRNFGELHPVPRQYRFPEKFGWLQWWMDHLKSTFRFAGIFFLLLRENQFDFQSIWKIFGSNLSYLIINVRIPLTKRAIILETFRTSKTLPVCEIGHEQVPISNQVFIGNFDRIRTDRRPWKIDDILQMNAKEIEIYQSEFTEKALNKLLKFWMKGVWPRLEKMEFCFYEGINEVVRRLDEEEILRGIKHQKVPLERKNVFLTHQGLKHYVNGGWVIRRKDGTKATVEIKIEEEGVYFSWYVWHPHCIVKEE